MCEPIWEALAEVYIKSPETTTKDYTFCLCSRIHVKIHSEILPTELEELSESYDVFNENDCENLASNMNHPHRIVKDASQEEEDSDANSCYYSASVTHTDNYCTTDEHERDSGADTSEYHAVAGSSSGTSREHSKKIQKHDGKSSQERKNSLPDIFGDEQKNMSWEKYWSENGEQLIWSSWIEKYSDFINPTYKNSSSALATAVTATEGCSSICSEDMRRSTSHMDNTDINADTEIIVSSCSPADLDENQSNQIDATDEGTNSDVPLRDLMDSLLIPRCDSVSSSIPLTIGTTDSMTNVTQMTLSSYGFCGSRVSSESSQLSESTPSSLSTPSNFDGDENTKIELFHNDEADQHWQSLWHSHFQATYYLHYKHFISQLKNSSEMLCSSLKDSDDTFCPIKSKSEADEDDEMHENVGGQPSHNKKKQSRAVEADIDWSNDDDTNELAAMGLPTSFGGKRLPSNNRMHPYTASEDRIKNYVKSAFALMGYSYLDESDNTDGHVTYRKRNIRLHNSFLKMKSRKSYHENPTATDETINIITTYKDSPYSSSDETDSAPITLPISNKNEMQINQLTTDENALNAQAQNCTVDCKPPSNCPINITNTDDVADVSSCAAAASTSTADEQLKSDSIKLKGCNKKPKKKRRQNKSMDAMPNEIRSDKALYKYWCKRFSLFSLFDQGIKLDRESWFSVTPEKVAIYTAERCKCDIIIDAFCGAGGNTIQFAKLCQKVIAIDIDAKKIEMAKHNATIYGVADRIEFIVGDFFILAESLKADVVFLSPPWGGPEYLKSDVYDIEMALQPQPATKLMETARKVTTNIAIYLPRNTNTHQLVKLAGAGKSVELEQGFLDRKLIAITAYYGNLLKNSTK